MIATKLILWCSAQIIGIACHSLIDKPSRQIDCVNIHKR